MSLRLKVDSESAYYTVKAISGESYPEETWRVPLLEYAWPRLIQGDLARNIGMAAGLAGWWSLAPLAAIVLVIAIGWQILVRRANVAATAGK